MAKRSTFWLSLIGGVAILLVVVVFAALHFGTKALKAKVEAALGPDSEVGEIVVSWHAVEVKNLVMHAPRDWPAKDTLRAERIVIVPDLTVLSTSHFKVKSITVEGAYLALWRTHDGKMRLVPSLIERPAEPDGKGGSKPAVEVGSIDLKDSVIEFFDGTVRPANHKIRLEKLSAHVGPVQVPGFAGRTALHVAGVIKGAQSEGIVALDGWLELATRNSEITTTLRNVDLIPFQPYLLKAADTRVQSGLLDLSAKATVKNNQLHVPGSVTLSNLELAEGDSVTSTFLGMPRGAVVAAMKNKEGKIAVPFIIAGNLDDPHFSMNAGFAMQVGKTIAQTLGISLEGLVRGATDPGSQLGDTLKKLLKR